MAYSAESLMNMTTEEAQTALQQEVQEGSLTSVTLQNRSRLQELIEEKNARVMPQPALIKYITKNTARVDKGFVTREGEFRYKSGKPVPKDIPYHIHYTNNFEEFYMSGNEHNEISKIIVKVQKPTDFSVYKSLVEPVKLQLSQYTPVPTPQEYKIGHMKRHFASKPNDTTPPFEISEDDKDSSPLYVYTTLIWHLKGTKQNVNKINNIAVARAELQMEGIRKILPDLQFFIEDIKIPPKQLAEDRISKIRGVTTEQNQPQTQQQTTTGPTGTPLPAGYNAGSGPPPGFGGTGGSGGY
tara:strand:- start:1969 stop:2862 length:894 start_codon:yes stop_codon:yes gene_type:complete